MSDLRADDNSRVSQTEPSRDAKEITPERWREIKAVVQAALDLSPVERRLLLDDVRNRDAALCNEVESLLAAASDATGFLENGAVWVDPANVPPAESDAMLLSRVSSALADSYVIERELHGGGMSRVFVATETALGRKVVVKILPPELGGALSAERFRREIVVAARLQHPYIVPLLSADDTDALLYYTMPFVQGESLRARLRRPEEQLPLHVVISVLRDIADALAYAHDSGVVHRDIKPDNILLARSHALVTDFGVAKALAIAAQDDHGDATLTGLGISLGTPAYMSPEQAAGDPIDARADLYAWGVVAYELLSGRHPFAGKTSAQQLVTAHISETPPPLDDISARAPVGLRALIMRCLAKDRAERPSSAHAIVDALDALRTQSANNASEPRRRWQRAGMFVGAAALIVVVVAYLWIPPELKAAARTLLTRPPPDFHVNRVVVAPLTNETGDPALAPLGAMAADIITERLSLVGGLEVVDASTAMVTGEVVSRLPRIFRAGNPDQALADETGSKVVVTGSFFRDGDSLQFQTKVEDAVSRRVLQVLPLVATPLNAPTQGLVPLAQRVAVSFRAATDGTPFGKYSMPTSMAAYEATREAYDAVVRADTSDLRLVQRAVALDSTFGASAVLLPYVAVYHGQYALADSALAHANRLRDQLSPFEQAFLDFQIAESDGDARAMIDAAERANRAAPRSAEASEMLLYALAGRRPRRALRALAEMDPNRGILLADPVYWQHLALADAATGDTTSALAAIHTGERRFPTDVLWATDAVIQGTRHDAGAASDAIDHLSGRYADRRADAAAAVATLLRTPARGQTIQNADAAARAFAGRWLARLDPDTTLRGMQGRVMLLATADRWADVLTAANSLRARRDVTTGPVEQAATVDGLRAVALLHLGRRAEAMTVDSALAALGTPRHSRGAVQIARARIAAHDGDVRHSVALIESAMSQGWPYAWEGLGTPATDPFLIPLHSDPEFRTLTCPSSDDSL